VLKEVADFKKWEAAKENGGLIHGNYAATDQWMYDYFSEVRNNCEQVTKSQFIVGRDRLIQVYTTKYLPMTMVIQHTI
jgi:hypothetical protein